MDDNQNINNGCSFCAGLGFIFSNDEKGKQELQKCDTCQEYKSDKEAQEYVLQFLPKSGTQIDLGNKCIHCKNDTSFGSGRFVNRYPAETDELIGYCCDECEQNYYKDNPQTESK